jgi:hypothetical protein
MGEPNPRQSSGRPPAFSPAVAPAAPPLAAPPRTPTAVVTQIARSRPRVPGFLRTGIGLAILASLTTVLVVVVGLDGWHYYWTPLDVRAYTDLHPLLRPSGTVGHVLGITGLSLMVVMHLYSLRKRVRWMTRLGSINTWLEAHIFCGFFGPVLVTLHTSFKFNGLISVAFWSMVIVVASGFVGRYLYVRIPRSIRGHELGRAELDAKAVELRRRFSELELPPEMATRIAAFEAASVPQSEDDTTWMGLLIGEPRLRLRLYSLSRELHRVVADHRLVSEQLSLLAERDLLLRRIAYLKKTKRLFDLWRVYHKPLAVLMGIIVVVHVGIAWYFGYAFPVR